MDELKDAVRRVGMSTPVGLLAQAGDAIGGAVQRGYAKGRTMLGMDQDESRPATRPAPAARRRSDVKLPPLRRKVTGGRGR